MAIMVRSVVYRLPRSSCLSSILLVIVYLSSSLPTVSISLSFECLFFHRRSVCISVYPFMLSFWLISSSFARRNHIHTSLFCVLTGYLNYYPDLYNCPLLNNPPSKGVITILRDPAILRARSHRIPLSGSSGSHHVTS